MVSGDDSDNSDGSSSDDSDSDTPVIPMESGDSGPPVTAPVQDRDIDEMAARVSRRVGVRHIDDTLAHVIRSHVRAHLNNPSKMSR